MVVGWTKVVTMNMGGGITVWGYFQEELTGFVGKWNVGVDRK